jgi:hypothetical protein
MPPENLVSVRFIKLCRPFSVYGRCVGLYNFGEVAAFEPAIAALLIRRGVAIAVEPGDEAA